MCVCVICFVHFQCLVHKLIQKHIPTAAIHAIHFLCQLVFVLYMPIVAGHWMNGMQWLVTVLMIGSYTYQEIVV